MNGFRRLLAAFAVACGLVLPVPVFAAQTPIHFADLNWESGSLITDILRIIVEKGYGLPTDTLPGTTITLETALANNDIQVIGEEGRSQPGVGQGRGRRQGGQSRRYGQGRH